MNLIDILFSLSSGMLLGLFYFGLLWTTVRSLTSLRRPALYVAVSFFARTAVCIFGFYLVMQGDWRQLLIALLGFVLMRKAVIRQYGGGRGTAEQ
jgi:F1F0 ATPase subunit 2